MGVVPEYRSQGVGRELVTACITWAKTHGYQKIYVNAYWGNEQARAFYKRVGFSEIDVSLEMEV
jgi:GNAT superfamily N-acetyltransferase